MKARIQSALAAPAFHKKSAPTTLLLLLALTINCLIVKIFPPRLAPLHRKYA